MTMSYPSKKITIGDVKEIKDFRANFIYNFFVPSESVKSGIDDVPPNIKRRAGAVFEQQRLEEIDRFLPRYVKFEFTPIITQAESASGNEFQTDSDNSRSTALRRYSVESITHLLNTKGIISEEELSNRLYTSLNFQDDNVDMKLRTFVSGTIAKRITAHNRSKNNELEEQRDFIIDRLGSEYSLLTAGKALIEQISESSEGSSNVVLDAMAHIDNIKAQFIDLDQQKIIEDQTFNHIRDVSIKARFNNKIVGQVITNVVNDPMSQFSDEFKQLKPRVTKIETISRDLHNSNTISDSDYDVLFNAIDLIAGDATDHHSRSRVIGYMIEKYEIPKQGTRPIPHQPIIIANPNVSTTIDVNVKYGSTYIYTIKVLIEIELKALDDDNHNVFAYGLVASSESKRVTVQCVERVSPPAPADFNIMWDYQQKLPVLTWAFPTNPQRDIKRFQVFRRSSINESFQLLKEFNFDDSWVKTPRKETPNKELVENSSSPILRFIDREFTKDSSFIYALCSIDAHDISSNYSMQYNVSFDRFKNRLIKSIISYSGAPKSYPNMMLNVDMFQDTIRDSNHTRMKIYFDPETIYVQDVDGTRSSLFMTKPNTKYRLQLLNVDLQKQEIVDINVVDAMPSKQQTKNSLNSGFTNKQSISNFSRGLFPAKFRKGN